MMLTLPPAPRRGALLDALESLVASAGSAPLLVPPLAPEALASAFAAGGVRRTAMQAFRAAGMPEPEVVIMGGAGAATAFRTGGKIVVRAGGELGAAAAITSAARAAAAIWRQQHQLDPAMSEDEEIATSTYLALGAAEAAAALERGERTRAEALVTLAAARSLARGDRHLTANVAWDLGPPLDVLYEDALRLFAPRQDELRARFQLEAASPASGSGDELGDEPLTIAPSQTVADLLAARPCACGGRWRVVRPAPDAPTEEPQRLGVACRVCLRWRDVLVRHADRSPTAPATSA